MPINPNFLKLSGYGITCNLSSSHSCLPSLYQLYNSFHLPLMSSGWLKVSACNCCFILRPWRLVMNQRPSSESVTCRITHMRCISSFQFPVFLILVFPLGTDVWFYWLNHTPQAGSLPNRHIHYSFNQFLNPVSLMSFHIWSTNGS